MFTSVPYCCPVTGVPLSLLPAETAEYASLIRDLDGTLPGRLDGLLASDPSLTDPTDRQVIYPVIDGIPQLIGSQALHRTQGCGVESARMQEIVEETEIYDALARPFRANLEETARSFCGPALYRRFREGENLEGFPDPASVWLDAPACADTQYVAYSHLAPLKGCVFLQFGGAGSHAIKALLAGAKFAGLLSPSHEEILLSRELAEYLGFGDVFFGIRGLGERIPLQAGWLDRIYGGGCLHHTDIRNSIPEIARVLAPGGRAGFVDPRANWPYQIWARLFGRTRFCGAEEGTHDHPLDLDQVRGLTNGHFTRIAVYTSGGLLRYAVVILSRVLRIEPAVERAAQLLRAEQRVMSALRCHRLFNNFALLLER